MAAEKSGGAATNTGIDFQQRVAAYLLAHMILDLDASYGLGVEGEIRITEVSFETSSAIDDIKVYYQHGIIYVQAKRSISLSTSESSEFYKTVKQFVQQHLNGSTDADKFVLATSTLASSRITRDLRKITESVRLNDPGFKNNPLNALEHGTYTKFKGCVEEHYAQLTGTKLTETEFNRITKKIFISIFDIQEGQPLEKAILTVLYGIALIPPKLVWNTLISNALTLAANRQSIDKNGLSRLVGKFISTEKGNLIPTFKRTLFELQIEGTICSGREVLLIKSFSPDGDYMILELIRFDDDGKKRVQFYGNRCELLNGETHELVHRASTFEGVGRYIENNMSHFKEEKIGILTISTDSNEDETDIALAHSALCEKMFRELEEPFKCLHCTDPISDADAKVIEIDDKDNKHEVGLVHSRCLRSIDRVLGQIDAPFLEKYSFLKDFDYETWFKCVQRGQGAFVELSRKPRMIYKMAWNPENEIDASGKYCIRIDLRDGSCRYVTQRGKVSRETLNSAKTKVVFMNESFSAAKAERDPFCYTSKNEMFSKYSLALRMKDKDEECIECLNAEVAKYTLAIEKAYGRIKSYYSPVFFLLEQQSGEPIILGDTIFLLSEPMELKYHIMNWEKAGIVLPDYSMKIIESDGAFDAFLSRQFKKGIKVIGNPIFDMNGNIVSGIVFENINDLVPKNA